MSPIQFFARSIAALALLPVLAHAQGAPATATPAAAAPHPITPSDVKAWNGVRQSVLSSDGKWFAYPDLDGGRWETGCGMKAQA